MMPGGVVTKSDSFFPEAVETFGFCQLPILVNEPGRRLGVIRLYA